jgi:hypothetical protein
LGSRKDRKNCISRKGAKGAKDKKFEARNPKFEQIRMTRKNTRMFQTTLIYPSLEFGIVSLVAWRDNILCHFGLER